MTLNPQETYVMLSRDGSAESVLGGDKFWSLPAEAMERFGQGWLVSEFEFSEDWSNWEMHPQADEFVYLLSGSAEMLLVLPEGTRRIQLEGSGAVIVPKGVWHTAKVHQPSRMLHVTMGAGTQHRPINA